MNYEQTIAALEAERDKLWKETLSLKRECEQHMRARNVLTTEKEELESLLERKGEPERRWGQLSQQIGNLKAERDALLQNMEYWRKDSKAAREELQRLRAQFDAERDELMTALDTLEDGRILQEQQVDAMRRELEQVEGLVQWWMGEAGRVVKERDSLREEVDTLKAECTGWEQMYTDLLETRAVPSPVAMPPGGSSRMPEDACSFAHMSMRDLIDAWQPVAVRNRIKEQFTYHMWRMQKPREVLWHGMPHSPLNPRSHILSEDCWCEPIATDYRK